MFEILQYIHTAPSTLTGVVTGELGDQLFGSDACMRAFPEAVVAHGLEQAHLGAAKRDRAAPVDAERPTANRHFDAGLAASWTETLLPALNELGLLPGGDAPAWEAWISPQLEVAPFPIVTTHDMLWWLNFSCKWQVVALRWYAAARPDTLTPAIADCALWPAAARTTGVKR